MVTAEITRQLGTGRDGKRKFLYFVAIQGKNDGEVYESPRNARKAAGERLKMFFHNAEIVEMWSDGKLYRVTRGGKPQLVQEKEKPVKDAELQKCGACREDVPRLQINGYGECRICVDVRVTQQRAVSKIEADVGPDAEAAIDAAVATFPATFGLRSWDGTFRIERRSCYVSDGKIQLVVQVRRSEEFWVDFSRNTIPELQKQIMRKV